MWCPVGITSHLDDVSCLQFFHFLIRLHRIARVKDKSNHITRLFKQLHWLPNTFQIKPKLPSSPGPSHHTCLSPWLHLALLPLTHGMAAAWPSCQPPKQPTWSFVHTQPYTALGWSSYGQLLLTPQVSALMTLQRSLAHQLHVPLPTSPLSRNTAHFLIPSWHFKYLWLCASVGQFWFAFLTRVGAPWNVLFKTFLAPKAWCLIQDM